MSERMRIDLCDGKYTYILQENGEQRALRYGEEWRDLCGDNLIRAMAHEIERLTAIVVPAETVGKKCICQGFYKPSFCPVHGSRRR